jgi:hypothetical protein
VEQDPSTHQAYAAQAATQLVATVARSSRTPAKPAKPAPPNGVQISGPKLAKPLVIKAQDNPELLQSVLVQVGWLAGAVPDGPAPKADKLGSKYTIVVLVKDAPNQTYDVYPSAIGGPRAYRPAKQPQGRRATPGWFYGRLSMSEALRFSGVPLPERPDVVSGGIGGGESIEAAEVTADPKPVLEQLLGELRRLVLLNGAIAVTIALGLAGMAFMIRRRV